MNLEKIKEKIKEKGIKRSFIAKELKITTYTLQKKLEGKLDFWVNEANILVDILKLNNTDKIEIF